MLVAVLSCFIVAFLAPWLAAMAGRAVGWLLALLPMSLFVYFLSLVPRVSAGEEIVESLPWVPALDVSLSFYLDGLSLLFALLISGIGTLIMIYAGGYLKGHPGIGRFYLFILAFMGSMLGLVLTGNLVTLFVFWELTSLTSYLLIGFNHESEASRKAALQALLVTGLGGLVMLAGFVMIALIGGSLEFTTVLGQGDLLREHPLYLAVLLLVLAGAFTKSAQFPFHFWLPSAMEAPTPVSAYLHSATMVKAGVYLLARMSPVLAGTEAWFYIVTTFGAVTMLVGGYLALTKTDLKRVLAYSTVSALGTLVLLLGLASPAAATAAIVFLLAHALYKGAFFMLAGAVDHETGTRNILTLGGLRRVMPLTAAIALLAAVSLAGFGPVFSFIAKELLLEAVLEVERARFILLPAVVLAGALFVAVAAIVGIRPFFGALKATPKRVHEAPPSLWLGPALLSLSGVVIGVFPVLVTATVVAPAVISVAGETTPVSLYLWHGFNLALALSAVSVLVGLVLYYSWTALRRVTSKLEGLLLWGPEASYERFMVGLVWLAKLQTQVLQGGLLRHYLMSIFAAMTLLVGGTLLFKGGLAGTFDVAGNVASVFPYEWVLASLILLGALMTILTSSRLAAIIALGVVGFSVALTFIVYGAPDVAMTQLFVETLTVILVSLVLIHLKTFSSVATLPARLRDAAIAVAAGATVTALMLAVLQTPFNFSLSEYFAEQSLPVAHGRNIVNVILVDFRALDTLGEITVLVIAGAGIFALLKLRAGNRRSKA